MNAMLRKKDRRKGVDRKCREESARRAAAGGIRDLPTEGAGSIAYSGRTKTSILAYTVTLATGHSRDRRPKVRRLAPVASTALLATGA
jgi:hypothetical protein